MAHFVKLDSNNTVVEGIVINNDVLDADNEEVSGISFLNNLYGVEQNWKQTSYNNNFRKQYAGIGYKYDVDADVFIAPQPFASWSLDENFDWQPPIPRPEGVNWIWDEELGNWVNG